MSGSLDNVFTMPPTHALPRSHITLCSCQAYLVILPPWPGIYRDTRMKEDLVYNSLTNVIDLLDSKLKATCKRNTRQ